MNEAQRITLQRYRRRLADDLIMTEEFLAQLCEEGIFEWGMLNIVKAEKTEAEQIYKLLELLPKRGPDAFDSFVRVLQRDYPWLATLLVSCTKASQSQDNRDADITRDGTRNDAAYAENSRGATRLSDSCDGDIKKLVASFIHRQFGQSKRISERDKKALDRFVSEQLQQERARYQAMLPCTQTVSRASTSMSEDNEVFRALEIQDHLFRIHMKIEPHLHDDDNEENNNNLAIKERILPDDLSFEVIHREMDQLSKKLYGLRGLVRHSLQHFKPEFQETPLPELVGKMHDVLRRQQAEMEEMEEQKCSLLDEVDKYSDHIEKLEKERKEYRSQVNVLHQDMAKVRQEKMALMERVRQLEKSHKERMDKESTLDNLRHIVKDLRANGLTPRQAGLDDGARGSQVRRSMRASQMKQAMNYPVYARRYNVNGRVVTKKKNTYGIPK